MVLWLHSLLVFLLFSWLILFSLLWGLLCSLLNNGIPRACPGSLYSSTHSPCMLSSTHSFDYQFYSNDSPIMVISWPPGILSNPPSTQTTSDIFLKCKSKQAAVLLYIHTKNDAPLIKILQWFHPYPTLAIPNYLQFLESIKLFCAFVVLSGYSISLECSSYKSPQSQFLLVFLDCA